MAKKSNNKTFILVAFLGFVLLALIGLSVMDLAPPQTEHKVDVPISLLTKDS